MEPVIYNKYYSSYLEYNIKKIITKVDERNIVSGNYDGFLTMWNLKTCDKIVRRISYYPIKKNFSFLYWLW